MVNFREAKQMNSKFNIESHKDNRRVTRSWIEGMLAAGHTCHCRTDLGTVAVRKMEEGGFRLDFSTLDPKGAESICSEHILTLIVWALKRLHGEVESGVEANDSCSVWVNQADRNCGNA